MKLQNIGTNHPASHDITEGHVAAFVVNLKAAGHIAAHLFRHTLASSMLQHGANLREISEVLRHQAHASTEIYAKIDIKALQEVARPWPGQGGVR